MIARRDVVLLAAGVGSRLLPLTLHMPKAMIRLPNGRSLLEQSLRTISTISPTAHVHVVTGYRSDQISAFLSSIRRQNVGAVFNPFYEVAGPLGSLWLGLKQCSGDSVLIANADTAYSSACAEVVRQELLAGGDRSSLVVSTLSESVVDGMEVIRDELGAVLAVGKQLPAFPSKSLSSGMLLIQGSDVSKAKAALTQLLRDSSEALRSWPWHSLVNVLVEGGVTVEAAEVPEGSWIEIDSPVDMDALRRLGSSFLLEG